jgi:FkbM family methyltransferase
MTILNRSAKILRAPASLLNVLLFITRHPLNKKRKGRALLGYLKWQIGSRLVPGPVAFEWIGDTRVIVHPGESGMTQNIYCGLHDFEDMAYVLHVLEPQDLFIDIGANIGSYTVLACGVRGARGYCFEPVPSTYRRLLDNISINYLSPRVVAMNIGLSNADGNLSFTDNQKTENHVVSESEAGTQSFRIPVLKLDTVLAGESPSMMKIDVEGFETAILDGAEKTLTNPSLHSVLIELNGAGTRYGFNEGDILSKLKSFGFSPYEYEPFSRILHSLPGKNPSHGNTLFLRNEGQIRKRLANAPRFSVASSEI